MIGTKKPTPTNYRQMKLNRLIQVRCWLVIIIKHDPIHDEIRNQKLMEKKLTSKWIQFMSFFSLLFLNHGTKSLNVHRKSLSAFFRLFGLKSSYNSNAISLPLENSVGDVSAKNLIQQR